MEESTFVIGEGRSDGLASVDLLLEEIGLVEEEDDGRLTKPL